MRFSTRAYCRPFLTCILLLTETWGNNEPTRSTNWSEHPFGYAIIPDDPFSPDVLSTPTTRARRETATPDFTWKATKTPKFITSKGEKHPEPVLRVYPPDTLYRSGRSRELTPPTKSTGRRVIYYATLPDVPRYSTNVSPLDNRYVHYPAVPNQQRSYGPSKGGKEFVTRVQSSIIDVRPRGDKKDSINSTPTFTIVDANTTPYSGYSGYSASPHNRVHVDYNLLGNVPDRPNYNYVPSYYNPNHPKSQYELLPPHFIKAQYPPTPYYGNLDKTQYQLAQYQYQHQSSPYLYGNDVGKLPSPYYSPPYPSRHTRFPSDRYPLPSPLSQFDFGAPPTSPPTLGSSHLDLNNHNFHSSYQQPNLGLDSPSATFSSQPSGLDFNGNLGSSLDHGLDLDDHHSLGGSPLKDKFLDYNSLSQKFFDFNNFNEFPPLNAKDPLKFDKEPFKGPFSQVSDWLTNKPFDLSSLDFDDANGNRDYQIKGSSHSVVVDSQMINHNVSTAVKDSNNTVLTPFTTANGTSVMQEDGSTR